MMLGICAFCHRFRVPILVLYAVIVLGIGANALHRALSENRSSEFSSFREIVQESVVNGHDPLETIQHIRAYPPFFAIAFAPFGLPPAAAGAISFVIVNIIFAVLSTWACVRACFGREPPPGAALVLFPLPGMYILTVIARCETDLLVLLPLAGALALMVRGGRRRDILAGVLLAFPAAMKLTPGLFGLFLLVQRRWAAFFSMAAAGGVFFLGFGLAIWGVNGTIERHRTWYEKVLKPYSEEGPQAFITRPYRKINQSPTAALFRFLNKEHGGRLDRKGEAKINVLDLSSGAIRKIATVLKTLILLALIAGWWAGAKSESPLVFSAAFASVVLGMLMLSDVSLRTHHAVLLFPYGVSLAVLCRREAGPVRHLFAVGFPLALFFMIIGALHIGKVASTLVAADFVMLACMLAVEIGWGNGVMR